MEKEKEWSEIRKVGREQGKLANCELCVFIGMRMGQVEEGTKHFHD